MLHRLVPLALALLAPGVTAQEWGPWHVLGPFDHPRGAGNIDAEQAIERELRRTKAGASGIDLGARHRGKAGAPLTWRELPGGGEVDIGAIRFPHVLERPARGGDGWANDAVAYLYRRIECAAGVEAAVQCGSDDGLRLWLNGELLVDAPIPRGLNPAAHLLTLRLEAGTNHLLAKVANGGGDWAFQLARAPEGGVEQAAVDAAIDRGVEHLLGAQLVDGSWGQHPEYGAGGTGYAGYCLLKCGLARNHPAIERARAFVLAKRSPFTYSASCEILFLTLLGRPEDRRWISARLAELLEWQHRSGLFSYPVHPDGHSHDDLSLLLYAALALREAAAAGFEVPARAWQGAIEGALASFEGITRSREAKGAGAGFQYRPGSGVTGSMTTAGVTVLRIAHDALGADVPPRLRVAADSALAAGLRWLDGRMRWGENPGQGVGHHYFWLYGIERVGSLLDTRELGGVDWYAGGAGYFLRAQHPDGSWHGRAVDTVLALLFLKRATGRTTGETSERADLWTTIEPEAPVRLAARGPAPLTAWVQGLAPALEERFAWPARLGGGLRARAAIFLATPAGGGAQLELGRVEPDPTAPVRMQELASQHALPERGEWDLVARLELLAPPQGDGAPQVETFESPPLRVHVSDVLHPEQLSYPIEAATNLLLDLQRGEVAARASSMRDGGTPAAHAVDGRQGSAWWCAGSDSAPSIRLELRRPISVARVSLSHAAPFLAGAAHARATRVALVLDDGTSHELELDPDPLRKSSFELGAPLRLRSLELRILELTGGTLGAASAGFAEIELQGAP